MKKLLLSLSGVALVFSLVSCNNDPKSAGEEVGKKYCECQKLMEKEGSKNEKAAAKCQLELQKMTDEYSAKFVIKKADMKKFEKSYEEYIEKKCSGRDYEDHDDYNAAEEVVEVFDSPASDARILAKKICKCSKLANEGKDASACLAEVEKMAKEHEGKYAKDSVATKEYYEAFMAESEKCQ